MSEIKRSAKPRDDGVLIIWLSVTPKQDWGSNDAIMDGLGELLVDMPTTHRIARLRCRYESDLGGRRWNSRRVNLTLVAEPIPTAAPPL